MEGRRFETCEVINRYVPTAEELTRVKKLIVDFGATEILNKTNHFSDFKSLCPDIAKKINDEEVFFALKNGYAIEEAPAKLLFYCKQANSIAHCANAVPHMLPTGMLEKAFTVGYLRNGWTMCDVLRKFCDSKFVLLTEVGASTATNSGVDFLLSEKFEYAHLPEDYVERHDISSFKVYDGKLYDEYSHEVDLND